MRQLLEKTPKRARRPASWPTPVLPKPYLAAFFIAVLAGVFLRYLYEVWPNACTAVFSPVSGSVWEYGKLLYFPYLAAAFVLTRGKRGPWAPHFFSLLAMFAGLLLISSVYFLVLRLHHPGFHLALHVVLMAGGFLLSGASRASERLRRGSRVLAALALILGALLVGFSFYPPQGFLFADPSVAQTFFTIPV